MTAAFPHFDNAIACPPQAHAATSVVVCVPTYRRAEQLRLLLMALKSQQGVAGYKILVGNNEDRELSTYPELNDHVLPAFDVIQVAKRGVSAVRNALIAEVMKRPGVSWIACLDDDQEPAYDWLAALIDAGCLYEADIVGGPVSRIATKTTFWSQAAVDTSYLPTTGGPTETLNEAGNLLLSTAFLARLERAPFSLEFGRTGGEDYEFFLYARRKGARIAWAPAARVTESVGAARLTFAGYVWRFYTTAAYQARADRIHRGLSYVLLSIVVTTAKAPVIATAILFRHRSVRRAINAAVQYMAIIAGRMAGLFGTHAERYGHQTN